MHARKFAQGRTNFFSRKPDETDSSLPEKIQEAMGRPRTLRKEEEVSPFFELAKYQSKDAVDAYSRFALLDYRRTLYEAFIRLSSRGEDLDQLSRMVDRVISKPLALLNTDLAPPDSELVGVRSFSLADLSLYEHEVEPRHLKYHRQHIAEFGRPAPQYFEPVHLFSQDVGLQIPIVVDLRFPNSHLEDEFHAWLVEAHTNFSKVPKRPRELSPTEANSLLACADLLVWAKVNGKRMPSSVLARRIFTSEKGERDSIVKTIKGLATSILVDDEDGEAYMQTLISLGMRSRLRQRAKERSKRKREFLADKW